MALPLRAYLDFLVLNRATVEKALRNFQANFLARHVPAGASGEVSRAAHRLALIAAAGELASGAGITRMETKRSYRGGGAMLRELVDTARNVGAVDIETAIRQVKNFIEVNGASRFQSAKARLDGHGDPIHQKVVNAPASALRTTARPR